MKISPNVPSWAKDELKKMGSISKNEVIMGLLALGALVFWIFGKPLNLDATLVAIAALILMVAFKIVSWHDVLENKQAWNILIWFATLVTLSNGLSNVGFLTWFSERIIGAIGNFSPLSITVMLVLVFYFIHYFFASTTAHVTALLPLFITTGMAVGGINMHLFTLLLLYSIGLLGIFTPYATGPSPIWYGLGYVSSKAFWTLGLVFGVLFIAILMLVGIPWIRFLG